MIRQKDVLKGSSAANHIRPGPDVPAQHVRQDRGDNGQSCGLPASKQELRFMPFRLLSFPGGLRTRLQGPTQGRSCQPSGRCSSGTCTLAPAFLDLIHFRPDGWDLLPSRSPRWRLPGPSTRQGLHTLERCRLSGGTNPATTAFFAIASCLSYGEAA